MMRGEAKQAGEINQKQEQQDQQRQVWKQKIDAAIGNEALVIEMLLACDFADGRLYAAQQVHSKQGLEQIKNAFKKSDKRVTKLAVTRLDEIDQQEQNANAVQSCLEQAKYLLSLEFLLPNHLIQIDAQKEAVSQFPEDALSQFQQLRGQLEQRMSEQVQLQRRLLNLINEADREIDVTLVQAQSAFDSWQQELEQCLTHALVGSLPKHTVQEAEHARQRYQAKLERSIKQVDIVAPSSNITQSAIEAIDGRVKNASTQSIDVVPASSGEEEVQSVIAKQNPTVSNTLTASQFNDALDGFERALQEGSFQQARNFDKQLREIDVANAPKYVGRQQKDRLLQARKQFNHLLSWAKWSGDASREELVSTAEGLANLKLDPRDIVETVTALRAQWKQMEATSGGAPKELWLRFDAACSAAYAPAGEHFQQQAELRKSNVAKAEQKLNEMQVTVDSLLQVERNWKTIGNTIQQIQQEWKRIGPVDRKEKTRLDHQFSQLLERLTSIFDAEQTQAVQQRRDLILQVKAIEASARNTADQVRALQSQWQSSASHIALERKLEQELWTEFRAACDAVFDARKQVALNADQERQQHLLLKLAVCEKIERFVATDVSILTQFRHQVQAEWQIIGAVPRQEESALNRRYERAWESVQKAQEELQVQAKLARVDGLLKLLSLAHQAESMAAEHVIDQVKWTALAQEWSAVEIPKNKAGRSLKQRWEQLTHLLEGADSATEAHRALNGNAIEVDHIVLNLEILLQIESPERLAQERRQAQLEMLQKSLKQGRDQDQVKTLLVRLLAVPVAFHVERQTRIKTIVQSAADLILAA